MKFTSTICAVLALALLASCQTTGTGAAAGSILTNKAVTTDVQIALQAASAYEAIHKLRKVTLADYEGIALKAVSDYAAAQASPPSPATLAYWMAIAQAAVAVYDTASTKGAPKQ